MNRGPQRYGSVTAPTAPASPAKTPAVGATKAVAKLEMLDGDEIIQLSLKPSPWFIPLASLRVVLSVVFVAVVLAAAMRSGNLVETMVPFQVLVCIAAVRVGLATLQWASRLYVLTNRRVMRFSGMVSVDVAECRLAKIAKVDLERAWYGRALRLGTIHMQPVDGAGPLLDWGDVSRPDDVHETLVRAIHNSQSKR